MPKPRKDGQFINCYLDRNLYDRLTYYAEQKGQTKTLAIERILKKHFDEVGVPENPTASGNEVNEDD